jgi:hypothetical protein
MLHTSPLARQTPQALLATPSAPTSQDQPALHRISLVGIVADDLGMGALLRFKTLMKNEGQAVQVARMCYDRLYACDRIALAHASASDPLRRLALELFQAYHRRDDTRNVPA